jgi:hypothetical protein
MSKLLVALLAAGTMTASTLPAEAGGYYHGRSHGYYGHHHHGYNKFHHSRRHHHGHRHRHDGDDFLLGAGIIGGAVILGSVLAQPRAAPPPPPPLYYYPPPAQPYCVQDQVYRTLPDGSIQWGIRTRCY